MADLLDDLSSAPVRWERPRVVRVFPGRHGGMLAYDSDNCSRFRRDALADLDDALADGWEPYAVVAGVDADGDAYHDHFLRRRRA